MDRKLKEATKIMKNKGISGVLQISDRQNKRFKITLPDGKIIHFGLYPFSGKGTFLDHKDTKIRDAWRSRHSKIMKDGKPAYLNKNSPEYYSWNILW